MKPENLSGVLPRLKKPDQFRILFYALYRWLHCCVPTPVRFSLQASMFLFVLLPFMPLHPLSLFIACGGGLSLALIIKSISSSYHRMITVQ